MREVTVHGEEKLAFCIMPDVITDVVCGYIAIHFIVTNDPGEMLTIILVLSPSCVFCRRTPVNGDIPREESRSARGITVVSVFTFWPGRL